MRGGRRQREDTMRIIRVWMALVLLAVAGAAVWPVAADSALTVYVTSQSFEGGRMYWRSDTGTIWVFVYTGQSYTFPVSSYSYLPDNPYSNQPSGYVRAINGFGKIWGSRSDVRSQLGWAYTSEIGFYTSIVTQGAYPYTTTYLTELDSRIIQINYNGTWQYVSSVPQPPPVVPQPGGTDYTQAAYQKYERGFMIWRADAGRVIVFWGGQTGPVTTYEQNVYGLLPDNPIAYVPVGCIRSINGFGKVWGNYPSVRAGIGCALGPEEAYTLTVIRSGSTQSFRLPDGRWAVVNGPTWTLEG